MLRRWPLPPARPALVAGSLLEERARGMDEPVEWAGDRLRERAGRRPVSPHGCRGAPGLWELLGMPRGERDEVEAGA